MSTEKTERGFNLWSPIITERLDVISFQESSAVGYNTWLRVRHIKTKHLNDSSALYQNTEDASEAVKIADGNGWYEKEDAFVHLGIDNMRELMIKVAEVIKYHVDERSTWYT